MNDQLEKLLQEKKTRIEDNTLFIINLMNFMMVQKKVPIHPVYSQNMFKNYYVIQELNIGISLFERSIPKDTQYDMNKLFNLRVEELDQNADFNYPLVYLSISIIEKKTGEICFDILADAMHDQQKVFNGGLWVEIMTRLINERNKHREQQEQQQEIQQIKHFQKLLRII